MSAAETTVTVLTAAGRSAVAVVAVEGPIAVAAVDACFRAASGKSVLKQPPGAIRFGRWATENGEEVIVCRRPDNPTDSVEVHCHGGAAAVRAVVADLSARGCKEQPWQHALRNATCCRVDLEAAEALRQTLTERTAAIALDQLDGAMQRELRSIAELNDAAKIAKRLDVLLAWAPLGDRLTKPWRVVVAGAPNVGKSSLINALLGYQRVIVFDQPGVTRDVVTTDAAIDGWPVTLSDTAGLRQPGDTIEAAGVQLARQALTAADLVIEVRDASNPKARAEPLPEESLLVWSKSDLAETPENKQGLATSAMTGQGIERLLKTIAKQLVPHVPEPGSAVPLSNWQSTQLSQAKVLADAGDCEPARNLLLAMLAPTAS